MIFHAIFAATIVAAAIHLYRTRALGVDAARVVEVSLLFFLAGNWGVGGVLTSLPHILTPDWVAAHIGWEPGSPFQIELGFQSLGVSLGAVLCIWLRGWFWIGPLLSKSVFLLGAGWVHVHDIARTGNMAPGNAGPVLLYDFATPVLLAALAWMHHRFGGFPPIAAPDEPALSRGA